MSPRPRTVDDDAILEATGRLLGRVGPVKLTLAHVAREVGLAPATLIQRFGSKRKLLLRFARRGAGAGDARLARLSAGPAGPVARVRSYLHGFANLAESPRVMANNLAALQIDLTDPPFHRLTLARFRDHERALAVLLDAAVAAGAIGRTDTATLARTLLTVTHGSLLLWAIYREGTAQAWLAADIGRALHPYLRKRAR